MSDESIKKLATEAIKQKYSEIKTAFNDVKEFDEWLDEQIKKLLPTIQKQIKSFSVKFEALSDKLVSMTTSLSVFIAASPTYAASVATGNAAAIVDYNTTASQLKASAKDASVSKEELQEEAEGLGIMNLPGFRELWATFIGVVDTYIQLCSTIPSI